MLKLKLISIRIYKSMQIITLINILKNSFHFLRTFLNLIQFTHKFYNYLIKNFI